MPVRATKRGADRTPLAADWDVVVCGASFAGLAVCRELAGSGARVLLLDRYEVGERQTSACAAPTEWLCALGLEGSVRQTFDAMVVHVRGRTRRWALPWTWSTFDYRELCTLLLAQGDAHFETATVTGPAEPPARPGGPVTVRTDRGAVRAPLVVDAMGWRRVLSNGPRVRPPGALLSRGLEVHPRGAGPDLELWLDPALVRAGYGWSFPAGDELRIGAGSFEPRHHVRAPTEALAARKGLPADGWQGCWIPHAMRDPVEGQVAFAGDSAGHCAPLTAEGIRQALFFGGVLGRELRAVVEGRADAAGALRRYAAAHERRRWKFDVLKRLQDLISLLLPTPALAPFAAAFSHPRVLRWAWVRYGRLCAPPARVAPAVASGPQREPAAA